MTADLPELVAAFTARLRSAELEVSPEQAARFDRAVTVLDPQRTGALYRCALATLVCDPAQVPVLRRVFAEVFAGEDDPAEFRGQQGDEQAGAARTQQTGGASPASGGPTAGASVGEGQAARAELRAVATGAEALRHKEFAQLTPDELGLLAALAQRFRITLPQRPSRRRRRCPTGKRVDLRPTLRAAGRRGGYPLPLERTATRPRPRRLVVLCDISGSMEPYARALVQLLHGALDGAKAEVFTFATRLTRLTPALAVASPQAAIRRAGRVPPDWSGGTRIADSLAEFDRRYGRRGMARGAVVLIASDGWETGDPGALGEQMARLGTLAYRIVWANPRTASPGYRPLVGGMAAAWPHCDRVVSAHDFAALDELFAALAAR